jgi:hypothetical protein
VVRSDQPQWRELGQRLAHVLRQNPGTITTPARLQGLVADLAADQQDLLLPLKDLVNRPAFQALIPKAGSGGGAVQRDVLIQAMEATFSRQVIQALAEVLDGFLDLPPGSARAAAEPAETIHPQQAAPASQSAPPIQPSPQATTQPSVTAEVHPQSPVQPAQATPPVRGADAAPLVRPAESRPAAHRLLYLSLAAAVAVLAGVSGVAVQRSTDLCALVGFCPSSWTSRSTVEALAEAEQAAEDLDEAGNLRAYGRALKKLEQQLLALSGARLTPEQEEQRQRLDQTAVDARDTLAEEKLAARRLEKASKALGAARQSAGDEREGRLAVAREALVGIAPGSFSAAAANGLRRQLEDLERDNQPGDPSAAEPAPDSAPAVVPAGEPQAPAPQAAPPPPPPPPAPDPPRVRPEPAPIPAPAPRQQQPAARPSPPPPQPAPVPPVDDAPYRERPLF